MGPGASGEHLGWRCAQSKCMYFLGTPHGFVAPGGPPDSLRDERSRSPQNLLKTRSRAEGTSLGMQCSWAQREAADPRGRIPGCSVTTLGGRAPLREGLLLSSVPTPEVVRPGLRKPTCSGTCADTRGRPKIAQKAPSLVQTTRSSGTCGHGKCGENSQKTGLAESPSEEMFLSLMFFDHPGRS